MKRFATSLCVLLGLCAIATAKVETWQQNSAQAFAKGKKEGVAVSDTGRVRLGRKLSPTPALDATHVWDLARGKDGAIYAATGSNGRVYRREGDAPWTVAHDAEDSQALSVAALPDGRVVVGTGPGGRVIEIGGGSAILDPSIKYIWYLAADASGNLFAATGPTGQLWKRDAAGKWSLLFDSKHPHLLCLAIGADGSVFAGSDGEGLVYKIAPDGKPSVLFDAPQSEIRSLVLAPDGSLFAGTAAEAAGGPGSGLGGGPGRGFASITTEPSTLAPERPLLAAVQVPGAKPGNQDSTPAVPPGGTASPKPGPPGENAVYRISADGVAREIFKARAMIYSLALSNGYLFAGTGPEGLIYGIRNLGAEWSQIARIENGQALAMLADDKGSVLIGAGDPGAVLSLDLAFAAEGSILSDVHDTKLTSRFGAATIKATQPDGTSVAVQFRSGNVGEPDSTWSNWSDAVTAPMPRNPAVPPGRFVQYRATLKTDRATVSPELTSVSLLYQTANLPPEIARVIVPDVTIADGGTRQTKLAIRWDVTDPNDDELAYTLRIRKEEWPDWITITPAPLTEKTFAWDTTAVPAGQYRLEVSASDRPSNPDDSALVRGLTSEPFVVDHQSPKVEVTIADKGVKIALNDDHTRLVKAAYALDGGEWIAIFPDDGLFDMTAETITIPLKNLKPGTHVLTVRATDAAGNLGSGDAVFKAP